jgi:hypothetical protein
MIQKLAVFVEGVHEDVNLFLAVVLLGSNTLNSHITVNVAPYLCYILPFFPLCGS